MGASTAEMRGVWIHSPYGLENSDWDTTIKLLKDNGYNAVFPNFTWAGVAEYPSDVLPIHPKQIDKDRNPIDRMAECLSACQKYGVELHAWVVCWNMGHRTPKAVKEAMRQAGRTQIGAGGKASDYLAPHIKENRDQMLAAILEIAEKYPGLAGIHLDYIRYPGADYDYSDSARAAFEETLGEPVENWPKDCREGGKFHRRFIAWKTKNISDFVALVYREVKKINPALQISAAVFEDWDISGDNVAQAPIDWINAKEKTVDFLCPMDYYATDGELRKTLSKQLKASAGRVPVYAGIGTYKCADSAEVVKQIGASRQSGADGFICFQMNKRFAEEILVDTGKILNGEPAETFDANHYRRLDCRFAPNGNGLLEENHFPTDTTISASITPPADATGKSIVVRLLKNGRPAESQGILSLKKGLGSWKVTIRPDEAGAYRLELLANTSDGTPILARSKTIFCLDSNAIAKEVKNSMPPQFANDGRLKVGVWQNGAYGATTILQTLQGFDDVQVLPLTNLRPESLAACDTVILPQPRHRLDLFRGTEARQKLRDYVAKGGRLIVTHTLVGVRGFVNPFPEIVEYPIAPPQAPAIWKFEGKETKSSFPDCIVMKPAESGEVLATAGDEAVVVQGRFGAGYYCAVGLGLGIGPGDKDAELSEEDTKLLRAIIL